MQLHNLQAPWCVCIFRVRILGETVSESFPTMIDHPARQKLVSNSRLISGMPLMLVILGELLSNLQILWQMICNCCEAQNCSSCLAMYDNFQKFI